MRQRRQDTPVSTQKEQVAPAILVTSILISYPIFALLGLQEAIYAEVSRFSMLTVLMYILIGLILCFFWRRMHAGILKNLTLGCYVGTLWLYLGLQFLIGLISPESIHMANITSIVNFEWYWLSCALYLDA